MLSTSWVYANFDIRKPCLNDNELIEQTGSMHKYYASMLAFNSNGPECLHNTPIVLSSQVQQASLSNDPNTNDVVVEILLNEQGKLAFAEYTRKHLEQPIALLVENKILSMLTVIEPITNGIIQIRGLWYEDAVRLSNAINANTN